MSQPFIGQIAIFGGNFAPRAWAFCNGQIMAISQNTALFAILGTNYGGDGRVTFALPDLRDRVPIQQGTGPGLTQRTLGEVGGVANTTLLLTNLPAHTHGVNCDTAAGALPDPTGHTWGVVGGRGRPSIYATTPNVTMSPQAIGNAGQSQPHNNRSPFLGVNFIICLEGIFPARN